VIEVDGEEVVLVLGENVHPQTYDLLSRDGAFASHPNVKWVFVDALWVPIARAGYAGPLADTPDPVPGVDYIPECDISLNVPAYSQAVWTDTHLFNDEGCATIAAEGCALTAAAMAFSYYGSSKDPGELNGCCATYGCRVGCRFHFGCSAENCSEGTTDIVDDHTSFSWPLLCGILQQNHLPLVRLDNQGSEHWVVVYKSRGYDLYDGSDYFINDPLDGSTYKRLAWYTNYDRIIEYGPQ